MGDGENRIWLVEPNAPPEDGWWQGRPIWQLAVTAPSAAFARLAAERWALGQRRFVPVGNESSSRNAGFADPRLYHVHEMPEGAVLDETAEAVTVLAGPVPSKARA